MKTDVTGVGGELCERVKLLLSTPEGTLVFDRSFGLNMDSVDAPPDAAQALLVADVEDKLARYVPEVQLMDFVSAMDAQGNLCVKVVLGNASEPDAG